MKVRLPSGELLPLTFYVTPLDSSCKAVLGYSFLTHYNPSIDWASKTITFQNTKQLVSPLMSIPFSPMDCSEPSFADPLQPVVIPVSGKPFSNRAHLSKPRSLYEHFPFEPIYSYPTIHQCISHIEPSGVDITFVDAAAMHIIKETGNEPFLIHAVPITASTQAASTTAPPW